MVAATQGPVNVSAFGAKVSAVAWKSKPSWFIVCKLDGAIAPGAVLREAHEGNHHGAEREPRPDALAAEGRGRGHHGRGGEGSGCDRRECSLSEGEDF